MTTPTGIRKILGIPAILLLGAAVVAGAPTAKDARAQTATQQTPAAGQEITDQDLQSYASAVVKVQEISQAAQEKMKTAANPAQADEIQQNAQDAALAAVRDEGLTVEKYNMIARATEADTEVRNKVLDYVTKVK